jgi:hypothetical protein
MGWYKDFSKLSIEQLTRLADAGNINAVRELRRLCGMPPV